MDPFVEWSNFWADFHSEILPAVRQQLLRALPESYDARMNTKVQLVKQVEADPQSVAGDAMIVGRPDYAGNGRSSAAPAATMTLQPTRLPLPEPALEEVKHAWVEIVTGDDERVVTLVEVLSPANKEGEGFRRCDAKRWAATRRGTNWVEIDLLLGGRRLDFGPARPRGDYFAHVVRGESPTQAEVFAWPLAAALPTIPVPLLPEDGDVPLDLSVAFAETYDRGQYRRRLQYDRDPPAAADPAALAFAREVISAEAR